MKLQNKKLLIITLLDSISIGILLPVVPFWILYSGGDSSHVTLEVSLFALGTLITSTLAGYFGDLTSKRWMLALLLVVGIGACIGLMSFAVVWMILGFRFLSGASAAKEPVLLALAAEGAGEDEKAKLLTQMSTAKAVGSALGPLIGSLVAMASAGDLGQFQNVILVSIVLMGLNLVLSWLLDEGGQQVTVRKAKLTPGFRQAVSSSLREIPDLLGFRLAMGFVHAIIIAVTVLYVHQEFGWGVVETGYMYGAMVVILVLTRVFIAPKLIDFFGSRRSAVLSSVLLGFCLLGLSQLPGFPVFVLLFTLLSIGNAILPPVLLILLDEFSNDENRTTRYGLGTSGFSLGQIMAGAIAGQLVLISGISAPYLFCSAVLGCATFYFYARRMA